MLLLMLGVCESLNTLEMKFVTTTLEKEVGHPVIWWDWPLYQQEEQRKNQV